MDGIRGVLAVRDGGTPPCAAVRDRLDARIVEIDAAVADAGMRSFDVLIHGVDERAVATRTPSRGMSSRSGSVIAVVAGPLAGLVCRVGQKAPG